MVKGRVDGYVGGGELSKLFSFSVFNFGCTSERYLFFLPLQKHKIILIFPWKTNKCQNDLRFHMLDAQLINKKTIITPEHNPSEAAPQAGSSSDTNST